jgi:hypothetical protein
VTDQISHPIGDPPCLDISDRGTPACRLCAGTPGRARAPDAAG